MPGYVAICIHLRPDEKRRLAQSFAAIAFCPRSDLFLVSGFFHYAELVAADVQLGPASDVGAGARLSAACDGSGLYDGQPSTGRCCLETGLATLGGAQALEGVEIFSLA